MDFPGRPSVQRAATGERVEVTPLAGLGDVLEIQRAVARSNLAAGGRQAARRLAISCFESRIPRATLISSKRWRAGGLPGARLRPVRTRLRTLYLKHVTQADQGCDLTFSSSRARCTERATGNPLTASSRKPHVLRSTATRVWLTCAGACRRRCFAGARAGQVGHPSDHLRGPFPTGGTTDSLAR